MNEFDDELDDLAPSPAPALSRGTTMFLGSCAALIVVLLVGLFVYLGSDDSTSSGASTFFHNGQVWEEQGSTGCLYWTVTRDDGRNVETVRQATVEVTTVGGKMVASAKLENIAKSGNWCNYSFDLNSIPYGEDELTIVIANGAGKYERFTHSVSEIENSSREYEVGVG